MPTVFHVMREQSGEFANGESVISSWNTYPEAKKAAEEFVKYNWSDDWETDSHIEVEENEQDDATQTYSVAVLMENDQDHVYICELEAPTPTKATTMSSTLLPTQMYAIFSISGGASTKGSRGSKTLPSTMVTPEVYISLLDANRAAREHILSQAGVPEDEEPDTSIGLEEGDAESTDFLYTASVPSTPGDGQKYSVEVRELTVNYREEGDGKKRKAKKGVKNAPATKRRRSVSGKK